jgi:hypothetical protein
MDREVSTKRIVVSRLYHSCGEMPEYLHKCIGSEVMYVHNFKSKVGAKIVKRIRG